MTEDKKYSRDEAEKYYAKSYGAKNVHLAVSTPSAAGDAFSWIDLNSGEALSPKEKKAPKDLKKFKKGDENKKHPSNISESLIDEPRKALQKVLGITAVVTSGDLKDDERVLAILNALAAVAKKLPKSTSFGFKENGGKLEMSFGGLHKDGGEAIEKVIKPVLKKAGLKVKFTDPRKLGGRNLGRTVMFESVLNEAVETTKEDPLVFTYEKGASPDYPEQGLTGHLNLSVAAKIDKFDMKGLADKARKAGVGKRIKAGKVWISYSPHNKKYFKEAVTTSALPDTSNAGFAPSGKFRGHDYFDCPAGVFNNCFKGKKKGSHWKKWLGDDKFSENVKTWIKANPKKTFLFRDEKSRAFIFARKFY